MKWSKIRLMLVVFVAAILFGSIELSKGATITVGPGAGYDFDSIQAGIDVANDGDEVLVAPGEYVVTEPITFRGKAIMVKSEAGPNETTVRMDSPTDTNRGSVVIFENDETAASVLEGFILTGGRGSITVDSLCGGGILFNASSGTVDNCVIVQNSANHGGGVFCTSACSPILIDCVIAENTTRIGFGGGGLYAISGSSPSLSNCIIRENSAIGSMYGTGCGGGVLCYENATLTMTDCTIIQNSAGNTGGGVLYGGNASATLTCCVIVNNTGAQWGGGVAGFLTSIVTISNCTICGNSGGINGGGVGCYQGASATVTNSIIWANISPVGREILLSNGAEFDIGYSNVAGDQAEIGVVGNNKLDWGAGNIDADPLFADPDRDDFHLKSQAGRWDPNSQTWIQDDLTSPCVDRGDPNSPVAFEPDPNGGIINMGAYGGTSEASMSIGMLPPFPPVAYWKLDETEGTIAHDSVSNIKAELYGDPVWWPSNGMVDGALMLDGIDDFVGTWPIPGLSDGQMSVFVWIKGGAPGQVVVSEFQGVNWLMADASQGYLKTDLKEAGHTAQAKPLVSEVTIIDGEWHRVGLTWDGTNRILYVDDVAVASDTQVGMERYGIGLNIGCGPDETSGTFFSGLIDDVRIYNRAITP